nr:tigger transposable element-derived protein 7-like [Onthophagus taurus]
MNPRKRIKLTRETSLEEALLKWYAQQRSCGVPVRAVELKSAAIKLANHMNIISFEASDGWLWRFRKRHEIFNKRIYGEAISAPKEDIEPSRQKLIERINLELLLQSQIYNADETGLLWRALPEKNQPFRYYSSTTGSKIGKERISALICATADGSHRLTPVIVGTFHKPRVLKDIMNFLPVSYYNSQKAWFTANIFKDWFFKEFIPAVRKFQEEKLEIPPDDVKCLLLLDNAPAHPSENILRSHDGQFNCMFLPKDTTSIIQPMDQEIILVTKRIYRRKFLDELMVVL